MKTLIKSYDENDVAEGFALAYEQVADIASDARCHTEQT